MIIKGIKCDHCYFSDASVKKEDYLTFVNKPCPNCGANLLTQKDYDIVMKMDKIFNSWPFKLLDKVLGLFSKTKRYIAKMDGSGKVELKEKDPE